MVAPTCDLTSSPMRGRFFPRSACASGGGGDEDGNAVDHAAARFESLLGIEFGSLSSPDGQIGDEHVGFGVAEDLGDIRGRLGRFLDDFPEILAQTVERDAAADFDADFGNFAEPVGVVRLRENGFGQVLADLAHIDVEGGGKLDIGNVIAAEVDVH